MVVIMAFNPNTLVCAYERRKLTEIIVNKHVIENCYERYI
jgi:hypothetical protein